MVVDGTLCRPKGYKWRDVHAVMVATIVSEYRSLPDVRTLSASDIRWYYRLIVPQLEKLTRAK